MKKKLIAKYRMQNTKKLQNANIAKYKIQNTKHKLQNAGGVICKQCTVPLLRLTIEIFGSLGDLRRRAQWPPMSCFGQRLHSRIDHHHHHHHGMYRGGQVNDDDNDDRRTDQ